MSERQPLPRLGEAWPFAYLVVGTLSAVRLHAAVMAGQCPHPYGYVFLTPLSIVGRPVCPVCGEGP